MSQSPNNQVVALTTNVVSTVNVPAYYERIIVTNNLLTGDVYVRTDGGTVATSNGSFGAVVLPSASRMIGNDQPREPLVSQASGSSVQAALNQTAGGANHTVVSLLCPTAGGNVQLEFV